MLNSFSRILARPAIAGVLGCCLLFASPVRATVTLEIFFEDGSAADGAVAILVADVNGDGFLPFSDESVSGTVLAEGEFVGGSDDVILALVQADRGSFWDGSAGVAETIERIRYSDFGIAPGTPLILYLFPDITQPGEVVILGDTVVTYRNTDPGGSGGDIPFEAPADPGVYTLAALTTLNGGNYDPQAPQPTETAESVNTGVPGSDGTGGNRSNATPLTSGQPTQGSLSPGDLDYYSFQINGLSRVIARTTGGTDTVGSLYGPNGALLNDPVADDGNPDFLIDIIVDETGNLNLAVRGKDDNQNGSYEVVIEVIPLLDSRPDLTIGKTLGAQRGDGVHNTTGAGQKSRLVSKGGKLVKCFFKLENDGGLPDVISLTGTPKDKNFKAVYLKLSNGRANVTAAMKRVGFQANLDPMQMESFMLKIKPSRRAGKAKKKFLINANSASNVRDTVRADVKAK